jgi:hypothetical protein
MIALDIVWVLLCDKFIYFLCFFLITVYLSINLSLNYQLRWKVNLMVHSFKHLEEIVAICSRAFLLRSYMFVDLSYDIKHLSKLIIELLDL